MGINNLAFVSLVFLPFLPFQAKSQVGGYQSDLCFQEIHQFLKSKKDLPIELKPGFAGPSQNTEVLQPEINSLIQEQIKSKRTVEKLEGELLDLRKLSPTNQTRWRIKEVTEKLAEAKKKYTEVTAKIAELLQVKPDDQKLYAESLRIYRHFKPSEDKNLATKSLVTGPLLWDYLKFVENQKSYRKLLVKEESRVSQKISSGRGDTSTLAYNEFILPNAHLADRDLERLGETRSLVPRAPEFYLAQRFKNFNDYVLSITRVPKINDYCKKINFENRVAIFKDLGVTELGDSHDLAVRYTKQTEEKYIQAEKRLDTLTYQYRPRVPLYVLSDDSAERIETVRGDTYIQSTTLAIQAETKAMELQIEKIREREAARAAQ